MPRLRSKVATVGVLLAAMGAAGCASKRSNPVVVRVGSVAIDKATVDHWTRAIELGSTVEGALGWMGSTPRKKALEFLISADWAIGAAAERGLEVTSGAIARGVEGRIAAAPHGRAEFEEEISATGQTLADVEFEVKAALAASALRRSPMQRSAPVTPAQVAAYYKRHLQSFRIPERRLVDLIEYIDGYARAVALGKRLGAGERFAKRGMRELVARQTPYEDAHRENGRMVRAIFATPPGRIGGPVIFHGKWVLLVVRRLVPGRIKPFESVRAVIAEGLSAGRQRRALTSFLDAYQHEWRAKTYCDADYIVQRCSEYRGRPVPADALLAGDRTGAP
jgi:hypothetical protein